MTHPDPSTGPAKRHARATGRTPSGTVLPGGGVSRTIKALLYIYIFMFLIGVIGSILSSGTVHTGFLGYAVFAGLLAYNRINSIIWVKIDSRFSRRGFQRPSGIGRELEGQAWDKMLLAVIGMQARTEWRMMRAAAWLMPRAAGRRWLGEAASFLFEASPGERHRAVRSYLLTAPLVIAKSWAGYLIRRIRSH